MVSVPYRLDVFSLSVANASGSNGYAECASHNGVVPSSSSVEVSCTAVARYLRFTRNGGSETRYAGLCEVVVIGHLYISK